MPGAKPFSARIDRGDFGTRGDRLQLEGGGKAVRAGADDAHVEIGEGLWGSVAHTAMVTE